MTQILEHMGVRGLAKKLFVSYLANRFQYVEAKVGKLICKSKNCICKAGVPQSSTLGPLLFILYINYVNAKILGGKVTDYVNDETAIFRGESVFNRMKQELISIREAFDCLLLAFNLDKTVFMSFGKNASEELLELGNNVIKNVKNTKLLGLTISEDLDWGLHMEKILSRIGSVNYALMRIRETLKINDLRVIYFALIQSVLTYGIIFWGAHSNIEKVLKA